MRVNSAVNYATQTACFSPYHFHWIFRALMGETLASFVRRVRLERSVYLLSHRAGASLIIALSHGRRNSDRKGRAIATKSPRLAS